ncbi:hypothetical protein Val02_07130 [Virgisporangium aliadipatigenens]|uniref:Squalene cyclase C-terminal domain-containing protein n=1 Tax=Virgisporangium aliadipatigenens TaxID=741659 RepID=A0A8J4DNT3_9ACTN|nr:prenyltransferase/squalene oxidase repeat-containing protein [Virgisporangium aliadipatigenens]GIJ43827.1 hypothetical protein Val02_07130 [Virgisporangium aliadipatigenens]
MDRRVDAAIAAAAGSLWRERSPDGGFTGGEPSGSVLATAGAIVALHAADPVGSAARVAAGAQWLRRHRGPDGGWGDPAATAVAIAALRCTGTSTVEVAGGLRRLLAMGGVAAVADTATAHLCRQFLDLAGLSDGTRPHRLPLELVLLDGLRRRRLGYRCVAFVATALLQEVTMPPPGPPRRWTLGRARAAAVDLLERVHDDEGRTGEFGAQPWQAALVCLGLARAGRAPHIVAATVGYLHRAARPDGGWPATTGPDLEGTAVALAALLTTRVAPADPTPRTDPVADALRHLAARTAPDAETSRSAPGPGAATAAPPGSGLAGPSGDRRGPADGPAARSADPDVRGFGDTPPGAGRVDAAVERRWPDGPAGGPGGLGSGGRDSGDARLAELLEWLRRSRRRTPFHLFDAPAGGWSRSTGKGWPSAAATAEVIVALAAAPGSADDPVLPGAARWLVGRRDRRGAWSPWVRDTSVAGEGPCPSVTARAVVALLAAGVPVTDPPLRHALRWLLAAQRPDGTFDRAGHRGRTLGTACVLEALAVAGLGAHPVAVRARDRLLEVQRADGSWGDGTAEETVWALLALLRAGVPADSNAVRWGVGWLLAAQRPDGTWPTVHIGQVAVTGNALRVLSRYRAAVPVPARDWAGA